MKLRHLPPRSYPELPSGSVGSHSQWWRTVSLHCRDGSRRDTGLPPQNRQSLYRGFWLQWHFQKECRELSPSHRPSIASFPPNRLPLVQMRLQTQHSRLLEAQAFSRVLHHVLVGVLLDVRDRLRGASAKGVLRKVIGRLERALLRVGLKTGGRTIRKLHMPFFLGLAFGFTFAVLFTGAAVFFCAIVCVGMKDLFASCTA